MNLAKGIGVGFMGEMKDVRAQMTDAMPTSFDVDASVNGSNYYGMVNAFIEALHMVKIELDDEVAGKFVEDTVARQVYAMA